MLPFGDAFALNKGFLVPPFDALLILLVLIFSSLSNMSFPLYILPMTFFLSDFLKFHPSRLTGSIFLVERLRLSFVLDIFQAVFPVLKNYSSVKH